MNNAYTEGYWAPIVLMVLLDLNALPRKGSSAAVSQSTVHVNAVRTLLAGELVSYDPLVDEYKITERGRAHLKQLCTHRYPIAGPKRLPVPPPPVWINPQTDEEIQP